MDEQNPERQSRPVDCLARLLRGNRQAMVRHTCAKCGAEIGNDNGPPDGWQLEDGRTICHKCCVESVKEVVAATKRIRKFFDA